MGALREPVGPLPASTYWRRRGLVSAVLVLLLLLLLRACGGGSDGGSEALSPAVPVVTPTRAAPPASPAPRTAATRRPTSAPTTPTTPTTTAAATPPPTAGAAIATCQTGNGLRLAVTTDAQRYPAGSTARFTLSVANTGAAPCRIGLGQGSLELRVASGSDRIWSSDDCAPGGPTGVEVLPAGERRETRLSWSLTRSTPGCQTGRPDVRPGTYVLGARVGQLFSPTTTFRVVAAD